MKLNQAQLTEMLDIVTRRARGEVVLEDSQHPLYLLSFIHMFEELRVALRNADSALNRIRVQCDADIGDALPVALNHAESGIADARVELAHFLRELEEEFNGS